MKHKEYICNSCQEIYLDKDDARDCCRPIVIEVMICDTCEEQECDCE